MKKKSIFIVILMFILISACSFFKVQNDTEDSELSEQECPAAECPQVECPDVCAPEVFEFIEDGDIEYVMDYDPTVWQYVGDIEGNTWGRIVHREIMSCEMFERGATEPPRVEPEYWDDGQISWKLWKIYHDYDAVFWFSGVDARVKLNFIFPTWSDDEMDQCYSAGIDAILSIRLVSGVDDVGGSNISMK